MKQHTITITITITIAALAAALFASVANAGEITDSEAEDTGIRMAVAGMVNHYNCEGERTAEYQLYFDGSVQLLTAFANGAMTEDEMNVVSHYLVTVAKMKDPLESMEQRLGAEAPAAICIMLRQSNPGFFK